MLLPDQTRKFVVAVLNCDTLSTAVRTSLWNARCQVVVSLVVQMHMQQLYLCKIHDTCCVAAKYDIQYGKSYIVSDCEAVKCTTLSASIGWMFLRHRLLVCP
jgi:hypothetical protein